MKHGVSPTRKQKILLTKLKLNIENWLVVKDMPDKLVIVHKHSNKTRELVPSRFGF